ncbi:MAG TPA: hypothetical protein VJ346_03065, partial [Bacteroidales bacterium]|nr:hypothetical protein [Bacteroidales bacterium]
AALFFVFCILYLIFSILAPVKAYRHITSAYIPDHDEKWFLSGTSEIADSLLERSAMLDSRLLLSENDSIGIFISLSDSLLNLVLQGVTIHQSKISRIGTGKLLSKPDKASLFKYLSTPFMIESYRSTIVKVPVVVKHAPKDTSEANKTRYAPQLPPDEYVKYTLFSDKSLKIIIQQEEKSCKQKLTAFSFSCRDKLRTFAGTSSSIFRLRIPDYHRSIKIKIPSNDARTIFRALPENASFVMEL